METRPFLELKGISKQFPGVKALDNVDLTIYPGEVHALVGENGAGKSTIIKIIMGVYQEDEGTISLDGKQVTIPNVIEADRLGLAAVYQDLTLAADLSIGENFFMGQFFSKLPMLPGQISCKRSFPLYSNDSRKAERVQWGGFSLPTVKN